MPQKFFLAMDTLCMGYECVFQKFTRWQLLSLLISTVSILQILMFEVFFLNYFINTAPTGGAIAIMGGCSGVSLFGIWWTLLIKGTPPGVLFWANLWWSRSVISRTCFAVGFHAPIFGGASVICRTVRMGVSSITLCSSSLTLSSACASQNRKRLVLNYLSKLKNTTWAILCKLQSLPNIKLNSNF